MSACDIKICGMLSQDEVRLAIGAGADFIGFVCVGLTPPGCLTDDAIVAMTQALPNREAITVLTPKETVEEVVAHQGIVQAGALQLCHSHSPSSLRELRERLPGVTLIQVVHMGDPGGYERALEVGPEADVVLLDSGSTTGDVKVFGGTGKVHNWDESALIVQALSTPVWLAGGLNPENVGEAIATVRPAGVDVCSGLRPGGGLDAARLRDFIDATRRAASLLDGFE